MIAAFMCAVLSALLNYCATLLNSYRVITIYVLSLFHHAALCIPSENKLQTEKK
jgi:hypothetical protein